MFLAALFCEVKGLGPEEKYFLTRFVQCFGTADPIGVSVKAFAKQFGLSDHQVSKSLDALVACGAMTFSSTAEGKGRPKRCFRLQDDFHKKLNNAAELPLVHNKVAVGNLLKHENRKAAQASEKSEKSKADVAPLADLRSKRQSGQLSVVNRLLLSVLLCHADRFGVVSDLGSSALCKVTGLGKEDLKHRVQRLIHQELIRTYVPGATSSMLFAKMKSVYFLNLNHPELSKGSDATSVLACSTGISSPAKALHAIDIYKNVNDGFFEDSDYGQVASLLRGQHRPLFQLLQVTLETCAAYLLSTCWSALVRLPLNKRIDVQVQAHGQQLQELIGKKLQLSRLPKDLGSDQYAILLDGLCRGGYDLAAGIKEQLCQANDVPFQTMDYVIIPRHLKLRYSPIALLALPKLPDGWRNCLVIKTSAEGEVVAQPFFRESDIPLEDRYRYGLLTRPGSKAKNA